jgi:hypothetical protein
MQCALLSPRLKNENGISGVKPQIDLVRGLYKAGNGCEKEFTAVSHRALKTGEPEQISEVTRKITNRRDDFVQKNK